MNHDQQQNLRAKLISAGFWDASARYDPTKNWIALEELNERAQQLLAESVSLFVYPINGGRQSYQVTLSYKEDKDFVIGFGKDIYEAICTAVLTLPALLAKHPKYAAQEIAGNRRIYVKSE